MKKVDKLLLFLSSLSTIKETNLNWGLYKTNFYFNKIKRFKLFNWLFPNIHLQSAQGRIWINLSLLSLCINYRKYYRNKNCQLPSWEQCRRRTSSLPRWWRGPWASPGTAWWASPPSWAGWPAYAPPPSQHNTRIQ